MEILPIQFTNLRDLSDINDSCILYLAFGNKVETLNNYLNRTDIDDRYNIKKTEDVDINDLVLYDYEDNLFKILIDGDVTENKCYNINDYRFIKSLTNTDSLVQDFVNILSQRKRYVIDVNKIDDDSLHEANNSFKSYLFNTGNNMSTYFIINEKTYNILCYFLDGNVFSKNMNIILNDTVPINEIICYKHENLSENNTESKNEVIYEFHKCDYLFKPNGINIDVYELNKFRGSCGDGNCCILELQISK